MSIPYKQFHIQSLHQPGKLIPEQCPCGRTLFINWPTTISPTHYKTEPVKKHPANWTNNPQLHTRPTTCKPKICTSYFLVHALIRHFQTHTTIIHPTSRLPCQKIRADLNNPTINRIPPPVIPTHYPHNIQHALNKPILHTIHNTHITLIFPNL